MKNMWPGWGSYSGLLNWSQFTNLRAFMGYPRFFSTTYIFFQFHFPFTCNILLVTKFTFVDFQFGRVKRIWYLSPMRAAKVQASLPIRAVSPEPPLLAHTSSESRGTFRQKARSLAPLNGWACAVKICHDGMLEDTNSLDGAQLLITDPKPQFPWTESVAFY